MPSYILTLLLPLLLLQSTVLAQVSGTGQTTRYWDCCKPSCGWPGKAAVLQPVGTCDLHDNPLADHNAPSGCQDGGASFMCSSQSPWAVTDSLAYGFAAVNIAGGSENSWCCACYELTFTAGSIAGKKMVVQATNTGGDLNSNQFDLAMPGGGLGIYDGCTKEWGTPAGGWGDRYGGVTSRSQCDSFADHLKPGCYFRFDWFMNADNPAVIFKQVGCPAALTAKTGCVRQDDTSSQQSSVVHLSSSSITSTHLLASSSSARLTSTSTAPPPSSTSKIPSTTSGVAKLYGQCGGQGWNGPTSCESGSYCSKQNDWYSQCLPTSNNASSTVPRYGQCGGQSYSGPTNCAEGSVCTVMNSYYSQCL